MAGLNGAMAGIPWWTTDIGGFFGGSIRDPEFKELLIRWFERGAFSPVFRLHGNRQPKDDGSPVFTGAANEVWSYGEQEYEIMKTYLFMRERIRPYVKAQMRVAHETAAYEVDDAWSGSLDDGGERVTADAPLERLPLVE